MVLQRNKLKSYLQGIVGEKGLIDGADTQAYERGARYGNGQALMVVRPSTVEEVSEVVKLCVERGIHLVAQGANTGLVGSGTPDETGTQLVLSLTRLRSTLIIDAVNRTVVADAGFLLQELNDRLAEHDLILPIDLGANPSLGGMVATNTGGSRLIRYGDVRHNLMSIEVVLFEPAGEIVCFGSNLRKDNTGYDLKQLFVGTSGVNGIITKVSFEVHRKPKQSATALVVPTSEQAVIELLEAVESCFGDFLSAFEGISGNALKAAIDHVPSLRNPFSPEPTPDFAVLIELESNIDQKYAKFNLQDMLNAFLEDKFESIIENAVVGDGEELWKLRHSISEGARSIGKTIAFDISVPRSSLMGFRTAALQLISRDFDYLHAVDFGHIADGGLHFNIIWPTDAARPYDTEVVAQVRDAIYAIVHDCGGSFSAEHGVGPHNIAYYKKYTSASMTRLSGQIKSLLDPAGLCGTVDFSARAK